MPQQKENSSRLLKQLEDKVSDFNQEVEQEKTRRRKQERKDGDYGRLTQADQSLANRSLIQAKKKYCTGQTQSSEENPQ